MWMEFQCEAPFVAKLPLTRQHFSGLCVVALGVYWTQKILASFFLTFSPNREVCTADYADLTEVKLEVRGQVPPNGNGSVDYPIIPQPRGTFGVCTRPRRKIFTEGNEGNKDLPFCFGRPFVILVALC
jgi:hypothetical protein